jgi:hypothetical protein
MQCLYNFIQIELGYVGRLVSTCRMRLHELMWCLGPSVVADQTPCGGGAPGDLAIGDAR